MKKLKAWLRNFFLPPEGAPLWVRVLPYIVLGALTLVVLLGGSYGWEYTNSPEFCGTSCHTMPPEYSAYQVSPHARIACVDCHIGKGFITTRITRKAGDLKHVFATTFKTYEYPIRAGELRPARETCEKCHFPEKFSDDSLREIKSFHNDPGNTPYSTYLVLKTGGGSERQGLGRGIHWHIQNKVEYLALDPEKQQIPYVRVTGADGSIEEYTDIEAEPISETDLAGLEEMDCISCHNRISHRVSNPEDQVDSLIGRGLISASIPEIRRQAVEVYSTVYDTTQMGLDRIASIEEFYRVYYPEFYEENNDLIQQAIQSLQAAYHEAVYPEQKSDWNTHPNNIGHQQSPGCFRCHDGKHLNEEQEAIRLECNLCHSIPVVAGVNDFVSEIEISRGPEPETHKNENWISLHNQVYDETCQNCHTIEDAGGTSNTSFCSNSACHGNVWEYAGFDAPALRSVLQAQAPPTPTPAPVPAPSGGEITYSTVTGLLLQTRCSSCHGESRIKGLNLTTYQGILDGGESGPAIIPGQPEDSLLVQIQSGPQPHFAQLSPEELNLIIEWIVNDAPK